jgi:Leucine-rich repeat (LRR) protein
MNSFIAVLSLDRKILDLKGNDIELDFHQIPVTSQLQFLRLSGTGINSISGVSRASQLQALHITNNHITAIPAELYSLTSLESLFLSFNSISGTLSRKIGQLTSLRELYLFSNLFTGSIPTEIGLLTQLADLVLAANFLSGELPDELSTMSTLEQLAVYDQQGLELITGAVPSFSQASNLWCVAAVVSPFLCYSVVAHFSFRRYRYFDASNNDLTGPLPDNFLINSMFTNATVSIYLRNNEITGTIPSELARIALLDLNLAGNQIDEIPNEVCSIEGWMQGNVGKIGDCSAILCPRGTFNQFGRQSPGNPCLPCSHLDNVIFLGQTHCENFTSERATLNSLYRNTGGEFWTDSDGWQTEAPICSWSGIRCEGDLQDTKGVISVQLDGYGLSGTLPSSLWTLPSLTFFSVKENPDLEVNFEGLENAADTLEVLYLSGIQISSLEGISKAMSLKEVHLTDNALTGTRLCCSLFLLLSREMSNLIPALILRPFPRRAISTFQHSRVDFHRTQFVLWDTSNYARRNDSSKGALCLQQRFPVYYSF